MIVPITSCQIDEIWGEVEPYIEAALERTMGELTTFDIRNFCKNRDMQLWAIHNPDLCGAVTTEIIKYPKRKILRIVTIGGSVLDGWSMELSKAMDAFARHEGASGIEAIGRKGWVAKVAPFGYTQKSVNYVKEL